MPMSINYFGDAMADLYSRKPPHQYEIPTPITIELHNPTSLDYLVRVPELGLTAIIRGDTADETTERMRAFLQMVMAQAKAVKFGA